MKKLVLFDFDGTITSKDTLLLMAKHSHPTGTYLLKLSCFVPWFILTKSGIISAQSAKQQFLRFYYKGMTVTQFKEHCESFCKEYLPEFIHQDALNEINRFRNQGAQIYIVSASPQDWIIPWATNYGIEVIATKLKSKSGVITGDIDGKNCNREEKVNRIKQVIKLDDYEEILAYGDSKGDYAMLELADRKFYKVFG